MTLYGMYPSSADKYKYLILLGWWIWRL